MGEKRFIVGETFRDYYQIKCEKKDYSRVLAPNTVARLLNEQQATINELQAQLREKEREERLYANEILELRETNKEHIKFKSLGGNY